MAAATVADKPKNKSKKLLREDVSYQNKTPFVVQYEGEGDNRKPFLENVKILGWESRNKGRRYDPKGINVALYEGKPVNIDHPDQDKQKAPRDYSARFGYVQGINKQKDGVYAKKLYFNPKHLLAEGFMWWVHNNPTMVGLSQNAFGDVLEYDGGETVEAVTEVRSIDLVSDPATTKGLFEAKESIDTDLKRGTQGEVAPGDDNVAEDRTEEVTLEKKAPILEDDDDGDGDDDGSFIKKKKSETPASDALNNIGGGGTETSDSGAAKPAPSATPNTDPNAETPTGDTSLDTDPTDDVDGMGAGMSDITDEMASAADKIFRDMNMDPKVKLKKIAKLLDLHHGDMMQEGLMSAPTNLEEAKRTLVKSRAGKSPIVKTILEALDTLEVKEAARVKRKRVNELISAASLAEDAVTELFREELMECKDERRIQLKIEDRRKIWGVATGSKITCGGQSDTLLVEGKTQEAKDKTTKVLTDAEIEENYKNFESRVTATAAR